MLGLCENVRSAYIVARDRLEVKGQEHVVLAAKIGVMVDRSLAGTGFGSDSSVFLLTFHNKHPVSYAPSNNSVREGGRAAATSGGTCDWREGADLSWTW